MILNLTIKLKGEAMSNIIDIQDDIHDEPAGNAAIKFTFTEQLVKELDLYAKACGKSKTEIARGAIEKIIYNDPMWNSKLYFFMKNQDIDDADEKIKILSNAPRGTLLKVAAFSADIPDKANILICNFIRISGGKVSLEIPNTFRPTALNNNSTYDTAYVKMTNGILTLPQLDNAVTLAYQSNRLIYTVPASYIWAIDCQIPDFALPPPVTY